MFNLVGLFKNLAPFKCFCILLPCPQTLLPSTRNRRPEEIGHPNRFANPYQFQVTTNQTAGDRRTVSVIIARTTGQTDPTRNEEALKLFVSVSDALDAKFH